MRELLPSNLEIRRTVGCATVRTTHFPFRKRQNLWLYAAMKDGRTLKICTSYEDAEKYLAERFPYLHRHDGVNK